MSNFPPQPYPFAKLMWPVCTSQPLDLVVHLSPHLYACNLRSKYLLIFFYSVTNFLGISSFLPFFWTHSKLTLQIADTRVPHIKKHKLWQDSQDESLLAVSSTLLCSPVCQAAGRPADEPSPSSPSQASLPTKKGPLLSKHHLNFIPLCIYCCKMTKTRLPPKLLGIHNSALLICSSLPLHLPLP